MNNRQIQVAKKLMSHRRGPRTSLLVMAVANSMMKGVDTSPDRAVRRYAKRYIKNINNACVALIKARPGIDGDVDVYRFLSPRLNEKAVAAAMVVVKTGAEYKAVSREVSEHSSIIKNAHVMLTKIASIRKEWEAASCHN